jgi:hypothetical protein
MQAVNLAEPAPEPELDELGLAHPAATKATAASAAAAWKAFLTCYLLFRGACCRPLRERFADVLITGPLLHPGATGEMIPKAPCFGMMAG